MLVHRTPRARAWEFMKEFFNKELGFDLGDIRIALGVSEEVLGSWLATGEMSFEPSIVSRCEEWGYLLEALKMGHPDEEPRVWLKKTNLDDPFLGRTPFQTIVDERGKGTSIVRRVIAYAARPQKAASRE